MHKTIGFFNLGVKSGIHVLYHVKLASTEKTTEAAAQTYSASVQV